jgi:F-type H+-transporting ATPase subunit b
MEILGKLGFEPGLFAAQIINFLVLLVIFRLFLYKPILKVLADRKARIAKGIEDAEAAHKALLNATAERDAIIRSAIEDADKIMEETRRMAESLQAEMINRSRREAERIVVEAHDAAVFELERTRDEAKKLTIELSRKVLDRILPEIFSGAEKDLIFARSISRLETYEHAK